jgi:fructose-bisphosphate aldolase class I
MLPSLFSNFLEVKHKDTHMTNIKELETTIAKLAVKGKGILAADESTPTITKRFQALGIECTEDNRRAYRELLLTTPGIEQFIGGVILFEETLGQKDNKGVPFPEALVSKGIVPGIKVDKGLIYIPNTSQEQITQGLDGLAERLKEYKSKGARFAKWRAVYTISNNTPTSLCIDANAFALARYAAICQSEGIVPIVEPEVLIDGDHTIARSKEVTAPVLQALFEALYRHHVKLEHIVLKPSMVINGKACSEKASVKEVAEATLHVLTQTVPAMVPTINFLSGGQSSEQATAHLNAMNQSKSLPWNVSFSYARALQDDCMKTWLGLPKNIQAAQKAFYKRAKLNGLAATGNYSASMENEDISLVA